MTEAISRLLRRFTPRNDRVLICAFYWLVVFFILVILILRDVQLDGVLEVQTDFQNPTPYVSLLGPPSRVRVQGGQIAVVSEPVYFDLRLPRWFTTATLRFSWETSASSSPVLGVWLDPEHPDRPDAPVALLPTRDASVIVPLRIAPRSRYGVRLLISAPGVSSSTPLFIQSLDIHATR